MGVEAPTLRPLAGLVSVYRVANHKMRHRRHEACPAHRSQVRRPARLPVTTSQPAGAGKVTTFVVDAVYDRNMVECIWTVTQTLSPGVQVRDE
jgi:hypothetical protein